MVEIKVTQGLPVSGMQLKDISKNISPSILIGAVLRNAEIIIPNGEFKIQENDTLYIIGQPSKVFDFCKRIGMHVQKIKNVMIIGGGRLTYYLAQYLDEAEIRVKIIEINRERCVELNELLPRALIIYGDGTDESLLHSENLGSMGAFVSVTGRDEDNLISALLAKQCGVQKVVAKVDRINHFGVISSMGIDSVVCPKLITTDHILRYVRGMKNALGNPVNTLYRIIGGQAEALEFTADKFTRFLNVPLKNLKIVPGVLVAAIVRRNNTIIPHGNDAIEAGDSVILIAKEKRLSDLNDILV